MCPERKEFKQGFRVTLFVLFVFQLWGPEPGRLLWTFFWNPHFSQKRLHAQFLFSESISRKITSQLHIKYNYTLGISFLETHIPVTQNNVFGINFVIISGWSVNPAFPGHHLTGVPGGPGRKVHRRVLSECFWASGWQYSSVHSERSSPKALFGALFRPGPAPGHSCKWQSGWQFPTPYFYPFLGDILFCYRRSVQSPANLGILIDSVGASP